MINIIACVNNNRGIGKDGDLLYHIPADLKLFNLMTCNATVIMGRKTWDSLPSKPLKDRVNVVLSESRVEGVIWVSSFDELNDFIDHHIEDDLWIIGGASLYNEYITRADKIILTEVDDNKEADTFFPLLDCDDHYAKVKLMEGDYEGLHYVTNIYQRLQPWIDPKQYNKKDDLCNR